MTDSDWVVADSIYGKLVVNRHDFRGGEILKTGIPPGNSSIIRLCEALQQRAERTGRKPIVIDVGANCGSYALAFAQHAARVIAIEPQYELYQAMRRTIAPGLNPGMNRIVPLQCAVGLGGRWWDTPDIDRSTSHVSDCVKLERHEVGSRGVPDRQLVIERAIDQLVCDLGLDHVDLLKIDTEGMEIDVIEGARETIAKHKPILFVEFRHSDRFKLQAMLFELGYPSIQVVDDNDFLCDPDVPFDARHSYRKDELPSLRSPEELWTMERLAASAPMGAFVEVGVYRGGSVQRLARVLEAQDRTLWAFDTFTGIPRVHALDAPAVVGDWNGGGESGLSALMAAFPKVRLIQGDFPEVQQHMTGAAYLGWRGPMVAFAHIDCGTWRSTQDAMLALWPKMVSGGIMLLGDYGYQGSKLAADTVAFQLVPKPNISMTEEKRLVLTKP